VPGEVIENQNIDVGSLRVEIRPSGSRAERFEARDTKASAQIGDFIAVVSEHRQHGSPGPWFVAGRVDIRIHAGGLSLHTRHMDADRTPS
jgi:hypothetical protein